MAPDQACEPSKEKLLYSSDLIFNLACELKYLSFAKFAFGFDSIL